MVKAETVIINEKEFIRTYSDENRYVVRDGIAYSEAVDPPGFGRMYTEGDVMELEMAEATESDYQEALRDMGVKA